MANGAGVSVAELPNGKWRVRWREWVEETGQRRRVQRERVVSDASTAEILQGEIVRALERGEVFDPEPPARPIVRVATLDDVFEAWFAARRVHGMAASTASAVAGHIDRALAALRRIARLPPDRPVPVDLLTRARVLEVAESIRPSAPHRRGTKLGDGTIRATIGVILQAWTWAADDPAEYPGLPPAPRDQTMLRPKPRVQFAPPAPTLAECDAVIRRVAALGGKAARVALPVAVVGRWTGLRVRQILGIRLEDLDMARAELVVTTGKSSREKAERRRIPIAFELRDWLVPYVERARAEGRSTLFARRTDARETALAAVPARTMRNAWEAATAAGEARRETWHPVAAAVARPDHAFRAALQTALVDAGVRDEVIDALVGHAPRTTRSRHYVAPDLDRMRAALDLLPPIEWAHPGEVEVPDNVVGFRR